LLSKGKQAKGSETTNNAHTSPLGGNGYKKKNYGSSTGSINLQTIGEIGKKKTNPDTLHEE